jgi:hypothetical protein
MGSRETKEFPTTTAWHIQPTIAPTETTAETGTSNLTHDARMVAKYIK